MLRSYPHRNLLAAGIIILAYAGYAYFFQSAAALDIPLHDTYFTSVQAQWNIGAGLFCLLLAGLYAWMWKGGKPAQFRWMANLHSIGTPICLAFVLWSSHIPAGMPARHYYQYATFETNYAQVSSLITIVALIFLALQLLFLIYGALVYWQKTRNNPPS